MTKEKKNVAIFVPARSGSKRIKNKNLKILNGKPLIWYTINSAKMLLDGSNIFVSTNGDSIAKYSSDNGCNVIMRPEELSSSASSTESAITHAINNGLSEFEYIIMLQPTSPIRLNTSIASAFNKIVSSGAKSLASVTRKFTLTWSEKRFMQICPDYDYRNRPRSQDYKQYIENGSIYIFKTESFIKSGNRLCYSPIVFEMNGTGEDVDIDEPEDLYKAEAMFKFIKDNNMECFYV